MGFYFSLAVFGCGIGLMGLVWRGDRVYSYYALRSMMVLVLVLSATVVSLSEPSRLLSRLVWVVAGTGVVLSIVLGVTDTLLAALELRSQESRGNKRHILGLDWIDPATGLINAQVFAERLMRMLARSERRISMLVEGPLDAEVAGALGPCIGARCLMPCKGLHIDCVAQVRVAHALVPHQSTHAWSKSADTA
ncbi:MAG: hypothetical protein HQ446_08080 [Polaromonas sp.]|nr:hypothetical protein [Polaromonas sp.]